MSNIWKTLKIKPTTDLKAIKKAYAEQVRTCHQEDEPERWQQLHDAFKAASNYARRYGEGNRRPEIMVERDAVQIPAQEERKIKQAEDYAKYFERISKKEELSSEAVRRGHGVTLEDIKTFEISREEAKKEETPEREPESEPESKTELETHKDNLDEARELLSVNLDEEKERWQKQVNDQLLAITKRPKSEQKQAWRAFFEHWYTDKLLNKMSFWDMVEETLRTGKFQSAVYSYMENQLDQLLRQKEELDNDIKARMQTIAWKCQWMVGFIKFFQGLRLLVCAFLAVMLLRTPVSNWLEENTKGQYGSADICETFAVYMNEKYDTTEYGAEQFLLEELVIGDKSAGYRIMQKESGDFVGYIIIDRDSGAGFNKLVCMDNLEVSEIYGGLSEEVKCYFVESFEVLFMTDDVAYHTKFKGEESSFVELETQTWDETFSEYSK